MFNISYVTNKVNSYYLLALYTHLAPEHVHSYVSLNKHHSDIRSSEFKTCLQYIQTIVPIISCGHLCMEVLSIYVQVDTHLNLDGTRL